MKKNHEITPKQAYRMLAKLARSEGLSPSRYAEERGVTRYTISKWKTKERGTITLEMARKLGIV